MVAVQGLYENGRIELSEDAPMKKANVIVIFPEEQATEGLIIGKSAKDGRSNKGKPAIDRRVQPFLFSEKTREILSAA